MKELGYVNFIKTCMRNGIDNFEILLTDGNYLCIKRSNIIELRESEQFLYIRTEQELHYTTQPVKKVLKTHLINKDQIIRMKSVEEVDL